MSYAKDSACKNCLFYYEEEKDNSGMPFMCRRYPPVILPQEGNQVITTFPRVNPTMLCGEHVHWHH